MGEVSDSSSTTGTLRLQSRHRPRRRGAAEEEPAEAFQLRIIEQLVCPHQPADQLDVRSGQLLTDGGDIAVPLT
jgi:hypothetical protein